MQINADDPSCGQEYAYGGGKVRISADACRGRARLTS
jgi:hypothetical protein